MLLKTKLSLGLGFLFLIILSLSLFCSYYVGKSYRDAENILKNNYDSMVYSRNMLAAIDDMEIAINTVLFRPGGAGPMSDYSRQRFDQGKTAFEKNLGDENGNITEIQEKEFALQLNSEFESFIKLSHQIITGTGTGQTAIYDFTVACGKMKHSVNAIYDLNLQAVVRKSQLAKKDTSRFRDSMALIGALSILLALVYFWYFPFYISNTYSYLSHKMKRLLAKLGVKYEEKTNDEALNILHAIDLLENKFAAQNNEAGGTGPRAG
jgi:hypothetical protein